MRWPLSRKRKGNPEAAQAIQDATHELNRIKGRSGEVYEVANTSRLIRDRNHFREQLEIIMKGA